MFFHLLLENERQAFLILLRRLASNEGSIGASEAEFIRGCASVLEISAQDQQVEPSQEDIVWAVNAVRTLRSRRIVVMELINIAFLDEDYTEEERRFIEGIASDWRISALDVAEIEAWVRRGIEWTTQGASLFEEVE